MEANFSPRAHVYMCISHHTRIYILTLALLACTSFKLSIFAAELSDNKQYLSEFSPLFIEKL